MTTSYRKIAVFADATPEGLRLFGRAALLARRLGAELIAVYGGERSPLTPDETFTRGMKAITEVVRRHDAADRAHAAEEMEPLRMAAEALGQPVEFQVVWSGGEDEALRFLDCDLMVAAHPSPPHLPPSWTAERLLSLNGGPMLLLPSVWPGDDHGRHVVIAWNGSRQARRAVTEALPLLSRASRVTILVVDGDRYALEAGHVPGQDLAEYLARFDIQPVLHSVASGEAGIADTITREAVGLGADMAVIGCYSRSRTLETIFGGVTRTLLRDTTMPLFLSF
ncbi:MAG: universal stress protein [Brevundimonas sp.]|jgi:nucleotide-binding universal stress UspA family protein|uniref:universal stress protein n=1 Tax=Brevundimonas sp. TaxID=1871086 RepID=UPI000DB2C1B2|nr:universal stress protein [Brevundimonas sp.]PZT95174.1 MAG: universal stress protein [Brevundimonas sp.]